MDRGLLNDATSTDDTPTPGYMLNEIARATMANYQTNVQIQDFLVSRVQHKHHNVKFKALSIIKHVCRSGRPEFKREMQRKVDSIKECLQFKGTPDPLRGDEPNRRVREAAREALDAIFDSQMPVTTSAVAAANRIQGMGNDWTPPEQVSSSKLTTSGMLSSIVSTVSNAVLGDGTDVTYAGHPGATGSFNGYGGRPGPATPSSSSEYGQSYSSSSSASSMAGFGNPSFRDARQDKTWMQKASEYYSGSNKAATPPPVTFAPPPSGSDYNYATNRGPNALMGSEPAWQPAIPGGVVPDLPQGPPGTGRAGSAASDGSYERSIVESLCEPSGLKPVPNETKLADFLNSAPSLSAELVGTFLLDTLNSDAWQSRTKALMVIAQLLQANNVSAHVDFWVQHTEDVQALVHDSKAGVRTQAVKVVKLLGGSTVTGDEVSTLSTKSSVAATSSASMKTDSLLDMLDEPSPAHSPHPGTAFAAGNSAPDALFAGLSIGGSTKAEPAPVAAAQSDIFSGLSAPAAMPASVNTNASTISGLDLLMDSPVTPVAAAPVPAPAPVGAELFGNMALHSAPAVPPAPAAAPSISSAFDFMDDLTAAPPAPPSLSPTVAPMNNSSTGFSFMGNEPVHSPHPPSNYAISSSFAEPPKKDTINAFHDLTQPYLAHGSTNNVPNAAPLQSMMSPNPYPSFPQQTNAYNQPYGQAPHMSPQYPQAAMGSYSTQPVRSVPLGSSVLAPGMLSVTAPRKTIPEAVPGATNSGFSFLGASPAKTSGGNDSFSFVTDAMRDMSK